jgi:2-dehydro-3-deoxyphosphogalactonate aldolase
MVKSTLKGWTVHTTREKTALRLIAILRGLTNAEAVDVGQCLYDAGFRWLEVPLNSDEPLGTIATLRTALPADCTIGAGTVITAEQVRECYQAGAQIIVSPNTNPDVIAQTVRLGMVSIPGAATPSEAFAAIGAGAKFVKIFPAEEVGTAGLKAWTAVIPKEVGLIPVGGIDPSNIGAWLKAGATGFGIGSALFKPGITVDELHRRAVCMIAAVEVALASTGMTA